MLGELKTPHLSTAPLFGGGQVIDSIAENFVVLVDSSKVVPRLGTSFPIPVEVLPFAITPASFLSMFCDAIV